MVSINKRPYVNYNSIILKNNLKKHKNIVKDNLRGLFWVDVHVCWLVGCFSVWFSSQGKTIQGRKVYKANSMQICFS